MQILRKWDQREGVGQVDDESHVEGAGYLSEVTQMIPCQFVTSSSFNTSLPNLSTARLLLVVPSGNKITGLLVLQAFFTVGKVGEAVGGRLPVCSMRRRKGTATYPIQDG